MKILIDHNLKPSIFRLLKKVGLDAESAKFNGMENLTNGMLSAEAHRRGFKCILTQDRTFLYDASKVLDALPDFSIILVDTSMLPQMPRATYLARFEHALVQEPIEPIGGRMLKWPTQNWGDSTQLF